MQKTAGPKKFSFYPISRIDGVKTCKNWFLSKTLEVEAFVWSLFFFVSMFLCFFVPGSLCFDVSLFLCFCSYVSLYLDFIVSMFLCFCASLFLCLFASLFLCFLVSLFLCLNFAKVHINLCLFTSTLSQNFFSISRMLSIYVIKRLVISWYAPHIWHSWNVFDP